MKALRSLLRPWQAVLLTPVSVGSVLLFIDTAGSSTSVARTLGISSSVVAVWCAVVFGIIRWRSGQKLPAVFNTLGWWGSLIAVLAGAFLTLWTFLSPPNVVYSLTRLNPEIILTLANFGFAVTLLNQSSGWWKKHFSQFLFVLPFWILGMCWLVRLLPFDLFWRFVVEDGPVEYMQVSILFVSVLLSGYTAFRFYRKQNWHKAAVFGAIGAVMLFFLLEEISWGQRLFGWQTPTGLSNVNVQNETTLHNVGIMNQLQLVGYIALSAAGSYLCQRPLTISDKLRKSLLVWNPPRAALFLFLIPLVFYMGFVVFSTPYHWAEIIEVLFYAGLLCWIAADFLPKNST